MKWRGRRYFIKLWKKNFSNLFSTWEKCLSLNCGNFCRTTRICVDGTANLCCVIHKWFAYRLPRIKICRFFARTQRELDAPSCSVCPLLASGSRKINQPRTSYVPHANGAPRVSGALVYTKPNVPGRGGNILQKTVLEWKTVSLTLTAIFRIFFLTPHHLLYPFFTPQIFNF